MSGSNYQHYEAINLEHITGLSEYEFSHSEQEKEKALRGLNRINLFIGPNNSGKSRLIRKLFSEKKYEFDPKFDPNQISAESLREKAAELQKMIDTIYLNKKKVELITGRDGSQISSNYFDSYLKWQFLVSNVDPESSDSKLKEFLNKLQTAAKCRPRMQAERLEFLNKAAADLHDKLKNFKLSIGDEVRYYIPILRGLRKIQVNPKESNNKDDLYKSRTLKDYFSIFEDRAKAERMEGLFLQKENHKVFTGQDLYSEIKDRLLGALSQRDSHGEYEKFLSENFFNNAPISLIPRHNSFEDDGYKDEHYYDMVWIKIGDEEERPICDLGDGLQTIILMTYLPFVLEERSLFFIEEPDAFLHPGMQRQLLEVLSTHKKFQKHQFFMTTHSNHILDMTLDYTDISTYLIKAQENHREIKLVTHGDRVLLSELGARSSSVFLTNASIWVEGVTDRKYIREFLKKYWGKSNPPYKEDIHYSFVEFGGSNIAHWDFSLKPSGEGSESNQNSLIKVTNICGGSFVVLDGDNKEKEERIKNLESALGKDYFLPTSKEIENLLDDSVIRDAVKKKLESSKHKGRNNAIQKIDLIKKDSYHKKNIGMGYYLDHTLEIDYFSNKKNDEEKNSNEVNENATIKSTIKVDFCERAVQFMSNEPSEWELTEEARDLCEKLDSFISNANPVAQVANKNELDESEEALDALE